MTSGKRTAETAQAAPYLAHSSSLHARHSTSTSDTSPRTRKPKSKKKREDRYEEEIQYNLSYDFRGASRRHAQPSRMRDESDFPPPPTYECATAAVSTLVSENFVHQGGPPHPGLVSPAVTVASLPVLRSYPTGSDRSDTYSFETAPLPMPVRPEEDGSSIELVDLEPSERWELDRVRGIPLDERLKRHKLRTEPSALPNPPIPHRARLASQPTVSRGPGSQARFLASQLSLRIPESRDRYEDDRNQDNNSDLSTPPTPKHHRMPSIPGTPSRFFHHHGRSHSPQPSSSVISLLRNPSPFFKSTPSLLNLSPSHHGGTPHRTRTKLFHRKTKERASSEPLQDWEVLEVERTGSGESTVENGLPLANVPSTPRNKSGRQLPKATKQDVFVTPPTKLQAERSRKVNTVQIPQTVCTEVHRPGSPPFVARHVRRHTTSSRGSQMSASSAPTSPISVASTATFNTSATSPSEDAIVDEDEDVPAIREVASEPPCAIGNRGYESSLASRTPRVMSPAPPAPAYEHDPDLPLVPSSALGSLPTRSATERIVRPPEENHGLVRGRSLSRDMCMRSAPAYSAIFPSGPPMPLPNNMNLTQSLPPPVTQPSPRRHYPGRPLPATPPVSPSLTWILDKGVVATRPKAVVSAAPTTPPIPEGLLIDLDDESLDVPSPRLQPQAQLQPAPRPVAPLCMDFLGGGVEGGEERVDEVEGEGEVGEGEGEDEGEGECEEDNVSDSGTVSPPGPLTPTTGGYVSASASTLTLSTAASRSVEFFDTSLQTTPTTDVPDVDGRWTAGGTNYDALSLIADLLGPVTPLAETEEGEEDEEEREEEEEEEANVGLEQELDEEVDLDPDPSYLMGEVTLVRRRVTRDGRVKLKMSLLGVAVEKCTICTTQFKEGDAGILGATCKHAFHEKCLETWLDRSQTCPLCNERLDVR